MFKAENENFRELIAEKLKGQHFMKLMGFELTDLEPGRIKGEMNIVTEIKQQAGFVHGGAIATMADIVAGFAAYSLVKQGQNVVTVELKVSYLNPAVGDKILAEGWVLKRGSRLHFCEAEVKTIQDGKEMLVAKATATMAII